MTEASAWAAARRALAPYGVLRRVEDRLAPGFPDVLYCLLGVSGLLEMKATVRTFTLDQVIFAEEWERAGGLWHALLRTDRVWLLLDAAGARRALGREDVGSLLRTPRFPVNNVLWYLAPMNRRLTSRWNARC